MHSFNRFFICYYTGPDAWRKIADDEKAVFSTSAQNNPGEISPLCT
jgi:hypothetical protein